MNPQIIDELLKTLQLIISLGTVLTLLYTLTKFLRKPNQKQDARLDAAEDKLKLHDQYFANDKAEIADLKKGRAIELTAINALLQHSLNGNNEDDMRKSSDEISKYLMDHVGGTK